MKQTLLFTICLLLFCSTVHAHLGGSITGTIVNNTSEQPLSNVAITLKSPQKVIYTNTLGKYRFDKLMAGTYQIEISLLGYVRQTISVVVQEDQAISVVTKLLPTAIALSQVTILQPQTEDQQLISSLDIKLRPITNSQEILRLVPGLFIGQHAGGGKAEQIFLRGFDLDHGTDIRLSVDGMPVNMVSHAHGQGYADLHFVIPELVQNVDFGKGPYQVSQGNLATAGYVNFKTRSTIDSNMIKLEAGQYDTYRAVGIFDLLGERGKEKQQSAFIASEYSFSNGYFDNPQKFNRLNLFGKFHGHLSEATRLTLTGSTFYSKWNHSGQIPDRAVASGLIGFFGSIDPNEGGETSRTNLNAELVTVTPNNNVIRHQLFYSKYDFELYSNFTFFREDSINGDQIRQKENRHLWGYNGSFTSNLALGNKELTSTVGIQYRQDLTKETELSHTKNRVETLEQYQLGNINEINAGIYIDEFLQLSPQWTATAGLRFDVFRNQYENLLTTPASKANASASILSPKLNLYYTPSTQVQIYLKSGKGFHSNDTRVVVPQNGRQILPAAYGSDLGFVWKPYPRLLVNAAAWYLWLEQEFVYVGDEGVVEPSGRSQRTGLDLSIRYQLTDYLYADADISAAKSRALGETEGQYYLPLAPLLTSAGGLSWQGAGRYSGSLRYRYMGDRPANEDNSLVANGYFVNDLQANYSFKKQQLGLSVQNLFNTRWKETQFATESRLQTEATPVNEIHFTPGIPFFARLSWSLFW
ncbi:TonB-dependent receptor (plasmid) [Adhaeribacter swui]|uniref:TonB-dependent receptor n=1 Tax=Adhaeribacter swui TaxID=2086471 RepID=A0A7G7G2C9_9BACT|nr:TonB-dependent receptor [Adhaeribacter swui]QNF31313.1 TonB-dependent receptor [Adhaeribacter swui]